MGSDRILRFTLTERLVHWIHAVAFFGMLATGAILYFPTLSVAVGQRLLIKNTHLIIAIVWAIALIVVVALGNRRALAGTWREAERIDADDRAWLRLHHRPQGRLNAGQKINIIVTAAFAVLFALSGVFLWLGEKNHAYRLDGAGTVHDLLTYFSVFILIGHLYLALIHPHTRHAMRGIIGGYVNRDWAARHHPRWVEQVEAEERSRSSGS